MHSSRMCTVRCSGHLSCHAFPPAMHSPAMHALAMHAPPATHAPRHAAVSPVDSMTDACENVTFPQLLLRTVNINNKIEFYPKCFHCINSMTKLFGNTIIRTCNLLCKRPVCYHTSNKNVYRAGGNKTRITDRILKLTPI